MMEKYISSKKEFKISTEDEINEKLYNLIFGSVLICGVLINLLMIYLLPLFVKNINIDVAWFVCIVVGICNIIVYMRADKVIIYFFAYIFMSISIGLLLASLTTYIGNDMRIALIVTMIITIAMMILGCIISNVFKRTSKIVRIALILNLIGIFICSFIFDMVDIILSFIGVIIFSIFIACHWAEANDCPKTVRNAVLNATDIYMDILNLFLNVLRIINIFSKN